MANPQGMADASGVSNPRANLAWQQADFPAAFLCHAQGCPHPHGNSKARSNRMPNTRSEMSPDVVSPAIAGACHRLTCTEFK